MSLLEIATIPVLGHDNHYSNHFTHYMIQTVSDYNENMSSFHRVDRQRESFFIPVLSRKSGALFQAVTYAAVLAIANCNLWVEP
jgi:hypothetical protein